MKWFKNGLSNDELKKEYRKLAKIHHPDLGGNETDMKQINDEYDTYYENNTVSAAPATDFWDLVNRAYNARHEAQKSREYIVFMEKNERKPGQFVAFRENRSFFFGSSKEILFPAASWKDVHEGFAIVKEEACSQLGCYTVTGKNVSMEAPTYKEMADFFIKDSLYFHTYEGKNISIVNSPFGDFYLENDSTIYANMEGKPFFERGNVFPTIKNIVKGYVVGNVSKTDFIFMAYQDCDTAEFLQYHDVDYIDQFHNALQMQKVDGSFSCSPIISYLSRKGVISIYQSKLDYTLRYGTFNFEALVKHLPKTSIEDVEEVQDFLDELMSNYQERVKAKIKKGKLKLAV